MFESLASCFAFRCSASLNSPQDESAVVNMTVRVDFETVGLPLRLAAGIFLLKSAPGVTTTGAAARLGEVSALLCV
jgi:hypothetical protein